MAKNYHEHTAGSSVPLQIRRSRMIRNRLIEPRRYSNMMGRSVTKALFLADAEATPIQPNITRDNIDVARDVAWAIKPEIDALIDTKAGDTQERIDTKRRLIARYIATVGAPPMIAASMAKGADQSVGQLTAIREADLERNYANAVTIAQSDAVLSIEELGNYGGSNESLIQHDNDNQHARVQIAA